MAIMAGSRVRVTEAGWVRYEAEAGGPRILRADLPRVVQVLPNHPPYENHALLDYPFSFFWFRVDELEEMEMAGNGEQGCLVVHEGYASYSYKSDGHGGVDYTPDAVFDNAENADWYGALRRPCGFLHPVKYVFLPDGAHIIDKGLPLNPNVGDCADKLKQAEVPESV